MEDFCRAVREGVEPRSSARIGLEVVETIEAVDESLSSNGTPVETSRARGALSAVWSDAVADA